MLGWLTRTIWVWNSPTFSLALVNVCRAQYSHGKPVGVGQEILASVRHLLTNRLTDNTPSCQLAAAAFGQKSPSLHHVFPDFIIYSLFKFCVRRFTLDMTG